MTGFVWIENPPLNKALTIVQKYYIHGKKIIYDENTTRKEINTMQSKLKKAIKNLKKKKTKAKKK